MATTREPVQCPTATREWKAWVNKMPPGPQSFHVIGSVQAPTPGYEVKMKRAVPQGINPAQLILDLELVPKPGGWPDVLTWLPAEYVERPYHDSFKEVAIRCKGEILKVIPIEEVF